MYTETMIMSEKIKTKNLASLDRVHESQKSFLPLSTKLKNFNDKEKQKFNQSTSLFKEIFPLQTF